MQRLSDLQAFHDWVDQRYTELMADGLPHKIASEVARQEAKEYTESKWHELDE